MLVTIKPSTLNINHVSHHQTIYPKHFTLHMNPASLYFVHSTWWVHYTMGTPDFAGTWVECIVRDGSNTQWVHQTCRYLSRVHCTWRVHYTMGTPDLPVLESSATQDMYIITSYQYSQQLSQYLLYPLFNSSIINGIQTEIFKHVLGMNFSS